jgi:flagellar hook-length control protein FliK
LRLVLRAKFFANHFRKTCVRASATSQTITPANIPAPLAKVDANKADAASPFALLMEATAKDSAKAIKKDAKDSADKPADDKSAVKQNDDKLNGAKQNDDAAAAQMAPKPAAKAGKPDKGPDKDKDGNAVQADKDEADTDAADDKQIAMVEQQLTDQQALPPVVQASTPVPADINIDVDTDAQTDIKIDGATPITNAATSSPSMDVPQSASVDAPAEPGEIVQAQAAPQASAQPGDVQTDEAETTVAAASVAAQAVPVDAKALVTAKDANKPVKTAAKSEAASTVKPETANVEQAKDELTQSVKASNEPVRSDEAKPAKTDLAKADGIDGVSLKGPHNSIADNAKPAAPDSQKADASQADVRPAETDSAPAAAKPAPQSATMSNATFAINTIAAPQAAQHSQAPIATQHVQVTAQPAPNVPALAVEIAAKSQSGAKQFDIRLDPPELGRVEVRLSIDATGKASAHLSADQPQTLHLLQKDAPILTRALREAGLDVSQDGLNFSLRQQAGGQNGNDGNNGRFGGSRTFSLAASAGIDPTAAVIAYQGLADGRVDIRV